MYGITDDNLLSINSFHSLKFPLRVFKGMYFSVLYFILIISLKTVIFGLRLCLRRVQICHEDEPSENILPSQANLDDSTYVSRSIKFKPPYFRSFTAGSLAILSVPFHKKL